MGHRVANMEILPHEGEISTPEEYLRYSVERLKADGRGDLLRWYLYD